MYVGSGKGHILQRRRWHNNTAKLSTFPYARCCCAEYEEEQLEIIADDGHGSDFDWVVTFKVFSLVIFVDINAKSSTVLIPGRTNHEYAHE